MVEMSEVIDKLIVRSGEGRVPWKTALGESSFSATFGNLAVLVSSRHSMGGNIIRLSVLNEKGTEITFIENPTKEQPQLDSLFQSAKRTALCADQKLAELMDLLDEAPSVEPEKPALNQPTRRR